MTYRKSFQVAKKFLVTSAIVLVAFFAGECPSNPVPQLAVFKVTINGTSLDLKDVNAVQENVPLQPTVVVTFDKAVNLEDVKAKVKLATLVSNQGIAVEIVKTSDAVFTISLPTGTLLERSTDYLITIEKDLKATIDGITYTLLRNFSLKFKTVAQNNDVSLKVEYAGVATSPDETSFTVDVPNGTNLQNILLKFTVGVGAKLALGETPLALGQDQSVLQKLDFREVNPKTFTVTAEDGTKKTYQVTVNVLRSSDTSLNVEYDGTVILPSETNFIITVPNGTNLQMISLRLTVGTGAKLVLGETPLTLGQDQSVTRAFDFSDGNPKTFTVTAEDGTKKTYQVTMNVLQAGDTSLKVEYGSTIISPNGTNFIITVPRSTNLQMISLKLTVSTGVRLSHGDTELSLGQDQSVTQAFDFSDGNPKTFTVTAEDGTKKSYQVTVSQQKSGGKNLKVEYNGKSVTPNGITFFITLPQGTDLSAISLKLTVEEGARLFLGNEELALDANRSITKSFDFQTANSFKVVAENGTEQIYVITVTLRQSDSKSITAFLFGRENNTVLSVSVNGEIDDNIITVVLPANVSRQGLIPSIEISGVSIVPRSGIPQDFTNNVSYTVTAADRTTRVYTIRVLNNYIVTFNTDEGGSDVAQQEVRPGNRANKPNDPTRVGHTFSGWYKESNFTNSFVFANEPINENTIVYAKWTIISYTVSFDSKNGTSIAPQTIAYGKKALEPPSLTRHGYTFGGWYKEEDFTNKFVFADEMIMENITLYAKWLNQSSAITSLSISGKAITFTNHAATINLPYGVEKSTNYKNLLISAGATANDANASGQSQALGSTGTLQIKNSTLRIRVTSEDLATQQIYTITIASIAQKPTVTFYTGIDTLGPAIRDKKTDFVIATVSNVSDAVTYLVTLGDVILAKKPSGGRFTVMQRTFQYTNAADNALFTIIPYTIDYASKVPISLAYFKPGHIYTWRDLQAVRENLSGNYVLMRDIDLSDLEQNFEPLGTDVSFKGTFNGNGKEIRGLKIDIEGGSYIGMFGGINHANAGTVVVHDLILRDPVVKAKAYVGALVGYLFQGKVKNVGIEGSMALVAGDYDIGGLVGRNVGTVEGYVIGSVEGRVGIVGTVGSIGGLVGHNEGTVKGYARGSVKGDNYVGGLVGVNSGGTVIGYATAEVTGKKFIVGGLVGGGHGTIIGYALGKVVGSGSNFGGLSGLGGASGYWDTTSTGQKISGGGTLITSIANVYQFVKRGDAPDDRTNGKFYDKGTGSNSREADPSDREVFNNTTFLRYFKLPTQNGQWPKLKENEFSLPQPNLPLE